MTGTEDFSGFEVIRAAMEVEKQGFNFYSAMAKKARHDFVKEIFTLLAQDEVGHLKTLEGLAPKYEDGAFWENEEEFLPYLRRFSASEVFPSSARLEEVLKEENPDIKALELSIQAEDQFAAYFRKAAEHARTEEGKEAFSWLAEEEKKHAAILIERKEKLQG